MIENERTYMDKNTQIANLKELRNALKRRESYEKDLTILENRLKDTYKSRNDNLTYTTVAEDNYKIAKDRVQRRINNDIYKKRNVLRVIFLILYIAVFAVSLLYIYANTATIESAMRSDPFVLQFLSGYFSIIVVYILDCIIFAAGFVLSCILFANVCDGEVRL